MSKTILSLILTALCLLFLGSQSIFFVQEHEKALVLQLGEPVGGVRGSGLHFKLPFVQNAVLLDTRIQAFVIPKTIGLSSDLKPFEIDNYACWRITDPLVFIRTLRNDVVATERLKNIVYSQLRAAIGSQTLKEVVGSSRRAIMDTVLQKANQQATEYGVSIIDVRIKRSDLPNRQAIFERMNADRKKIANQYRAEGESTSRDIRSQAEKVRDIILAEAEKQSTIIRGNADATAQHTVGKAISVAPELYEFLKSLEIYRAGLKGKTKIILPSDTPVLQYFK